MAEGSAPDLPPIRPFASRLGAVAVSLGLVAGYMAVRGMIYAIFPAASDLQWNLRDLAMDLPRAFFGFAAWRYGRRLWKPHQLGLHGQKWRECAAIGVFLCLPLLARPLFFAVARPDPGWLAVAMLSSFVVGFFEEMLFRAVLLRALYDQYGARAALWGTGVAFTLFHVQAQPVTTWPTIFVIGMLFALMRLEGISVWALAVMHSVYDAVALAVQPAAHDFPPFWGLSVFLYLTYVAVMYGMAYRIGVLKRAAF